MWCLTIQVGDAELDVVGLILANKSDIGIRYIVVSIRTEQSQP